MIWAGNGRLPNLHKDEHMNIEIQEWIFDEENDRVYPIRDAELWTAGADGSVHCDLCYRQCVIPSGAAGWCNFRFNFEGKMALTTHGIIAALVKQMSGYQACPFLTFKPGTLTLFVGGIFCTAACKFCMSTDIALNPSRVAWLGSRPANFATPAGHYHRLAYLHPNGVIEIAKQWGCTRILFGINEPLLTWEYTYDVARLAKQAGLDVVVETNGFSAPEAVQRLAPYVDAVDLGIKGSASPAFYEKWMDSPGALTAVFQSALEWKRGGVHLIIGDVVAPPHMQDEGETIEAQNRLYGWIADNLGEHTPVLITPMMQPGPQQPDKEARLNGLFLPGTAVAADMVRYSQRVYASLGRARAAGLAYAHLKTNTETITCHSCGGVLLCFQSPMKCCDPCLMPTDFCRWWKHEQYVTNGRCDHCGTAVPIVTATAEELAAARQHIGAGFPPGFRQRDATPGAVWKSFNVEDTTTTKKDIFFYGT